MESLPLKIQSSLKETPSLTNLDEIGSCQLIFSVPLSCFTFCGVYQHIKSSYLFGYLFIVYFSPIKM